MIRRGTGSNSDQFINVSNGNAKSSKLEEKQRRLKESEKQVQVTKVDPTKVMADRVNESKKLIRDEEEVPTGFLDEDEGFEEERTVNTGYHTNPRSSKVDEEEVPTGFLDEDEEEFDGNSRLKVLKVEKVQRPVDTSNREPEMVRTSPQRKEVVRNSNTMETTTDGGMRNPVRPRRQHQGTINTTGRRESSSFVASEPPVREEDRSKGSNAVDQKGMTNVPPKKKGSKAGIVVGLLAVVAIGVVGVAVIPKFLNNTSTEGKTNITLETVTSMVDSLYTDATKVNIRDDVTEVEVNECLSALDSYKNSVNYNAEDYDKVSKEINTIKFFLQDIEKYDDLVHGVYEFGSDEYTNQVSIIKSDIYLYSVAGLADTMSTKIKILETTSGTADEGSDAKEEATTPEEEMQVEEEPTETDGDTVIEYQKDDTSEGNETEGVIGSESGVAEEPQEAESSEDIEQGEDTTRDYKSSKDKASELVNQVLGEIKKDGN